jgi:predicted adenine nucleotide alpha hydrolase (AANH) superfamily ATPase
VGCIFKNRLELLRKVAIYRDVTSEKPPILLHVCCGPCATHPIQALSRSFAITGFFFNPNIFPVNEYNLRLNEVEKYFTKMKLPLIIPAQEQTAWHQLTKSYSEESEGGLRCDECFRFRLNTTARYAKENGFPVFTTTLTVGPNKPARIIFPIAEAASRISDVAFLPYDFKKKNGFKVSTQLSRDEQMYRQNYCGCEYSIRKQTV